jgi:hypothetical protein
MRPLARSTFLLVLALSARAAVINVVPGDSYTKIESAQAGDEVVIAPGTYTFRVYLTKKAPTNNPIVIRAQNPANPPVWDFLSWTNVENAPGSYGAGDRGRGGWQFSGASNYRLSGIVFRNCRTASFNSAGIRYYNGSTNIYVKDCLFAYNDDGITGGTQESEITVEHCEFDSNGNTNASTSSPTHNLYIYGGTYTMRYCYLHDSAQSQNFHVRARQTVLEYNWFARAKAYEGDLMTDDDFSGSGPFTQTMILRGNVFVQAAAPANHSQVVAIYNDASLTNLTLSVRAVYNTFVGNGGSAAFIHVSNADGTQMSAEESDNIIFGTTRPVLIENTNKASVYGSNNWMQTNAIVTPFTASVQSASPGFRNVAAKDFTLAPGSVCINAANALVYGLPGREYFQNEVTNRMWRPRAAARDIGAFESTSASQPIDPYSAFPPPQLNAGRSGANVVLAWPLFALDFQLQRSALLNPVLWNPAGLAYNTSAAGIYATVPASGQGFYRLKR